MNGHAPGSRRYHSVHLDAVRGLAALAVVAFHIRYKFFLDYGDLASPSLPATLFYVATSFGHDAVMVFFVLSGYLISGTVLKDLRRQDWSWPRYLTNRITRLHVVLIPGLLLTLGWDLLGLSLFGQHPAYTGAVQSWKHDFFPVAANISPAIFGANLLLQHAVAGTPPLGSNSPLWSLTYEFAYYLIFPAACLLCWPGISWSRRVAGGLLAGLLAYRYGLQIMGYFPIWLFGLLLRFAPTVAAIRRIPPWMRQAAVAIFVLGGLCARHTSLVAARTGNSLLLGDYFVAVIFALGLYVLIHDDRPLPASGWYQRLAHGSSQISYTLYVVHMPLLIFLRAALTQNTAWSPEPRMFAAALALMSVTLAYTVAIWFVAEARTDRVRQWIVSQVPALGAAAPRGTR